MLFVKLENEKETIVFLNSDFRKNQMDYEWEQYIVKEARLGKEIEFSLPDVETVKYTTVIKIQMPTKVTEKSAFSRHCVELRKGDQVIIRSNATCKVKKAVWNRIWEFFK